MKYLNLTPDFNPFNSIASDTLKFVSFFFNGGEPHIKIDNTYYITSEVMITIRLNSMDDLGMLMVAKDALDRLIMEDSNYGQITPNIHLFIPYFPAARQDRVMKVGEALTVKVFADLINLMNFKTVSVYDPHSDVTAACLDRCRVVNNHQFVLEALLTMENHLEIDLSKALIVSPDAGSNKKIEKLMLFLNERLGTSRLPEVLKCDKTRDTSTGEILKFDVYAEDLKGKTCIMVDDICSNGGTFMGLAAEILNKKGGDQHLIISHPEFGDDIHQTILRLENMFDTITFTDSRFTMNTMVEGEHYLHQIPLSKVI